MPRSLRPLTLRALTAAGLLAALALAPTVASAQPGRASAPRAVAHTPKWRHVFVIVMENLGDAAALGVPKYAALAAKYASASDMYGSSHPSLPNYLALTGGSTFGISSDCLTCYVNADNLGAQLSAKHVTWGDYSESVGSSCYLGTSYGEYAAKHNPFRYYDDIRSSTSLCGHLHPLTTLTGLLGKSASAVPAFSFITPNLCDDGHDCSPSVASAWLTTFLGKLTGSAAYRDHGLVIVTWDEASDSDTSSISPSGKVSASGGGGHVLTLFAAPGVPRGTVVHAPLDHEALLATIEKDFGLPYLGGAAAWSSHTLSLP